MTPSLLQSVDRSAPALILGRGPDFWVWIIGLAILLVCAVSLFPNGALAQAQLPGTDASDKLEAAGTLLRIIDTALFKWAARVFAGLCLLSTAWSLKEQRIGIAMAFIMVFVSELAGASSGLGYFIAYAQITYRIDRMIAGLIVLGALAAGTDQMFVRFSRKIFPWLV